MGRGLIIGEDMPHVWLISNSILVVVAGLIGYTILRKRI